jgi:tricorn protease
MRMPATLIQGADGKDMENHPRPVDLPVTRPIGESYTGKDSQLDVGLRELLAQLANSGAIVSTTAPAAWARESR